MQLQAGYGSSGAISIQQSHDATHRPQVCIMEGQHSGIADQAGLIQAIKPARRKVAFGVQSVNAEGLVHCA